jgi:hypothetical protein
MLPPGLHSQQAGTILPTLMLLPPLQPPEADRLQFPRTQVARMIGNSFLKRD